MRILPEKIGQERPAEDKDSRLLHIANHAPCGQSDFPARDVVDGGFLELVRYGIRRADDPTIVSTVGVIDTVIKTDTPAGPTWHRYNHDGYGQQEGGGPFTQFGVGRVWPLLTGERGHYELAVGRSTETCIRTMEGLASTTGLLPEQAWDQADDPKIYMFLGQPTGSAMPLMWAHAEYIKLLRSTADGKVYDTIPEVAVRYLGQRGKRKQLEVWKSSRHVRFMRAGEVLRVQGAAPFTLHWSSDNWNSVQDTKSTRNALDIDYVDLMDVVTSPGMCIRFTFCWTERNRWEGQDYEVTVR
jgi:glucoamylase